MKKYELVIFDLDGTILNTLEDLANAVNHALSMYNLEECSFKQVESYIGNGIRDLIKTSSKSDDETIINSLLKEFVMYYSEHFADYTKPYDGIVELLNRLRMEGYKLAVASNKKCEITKKLIDKFFFGIFDVVLGERADLKRKPSPEMVDYIINNLNIDKNKALYIGDSDVDYKTALNANLDHLIVSYGFRSKDKLHSVGVEKTIDSVDELCSFFFD